jgi:hypothetical protein
VRKLIHRHIHSQQLSLRCSLIEFPQVGDRSFKELSGQFIRFPCNCSRPIERNWSHSSLPRICTAAVPPLHPATLHSSETNISVTSIHRYNAAAVHGRWLGPGTENHWAILLIYLWVLFNNVVTVLGAPLSDPLLVCNSNLFIRRIFCWTLTLARSIFKYTAFREHFCPIQFLSPADGI